MKLKIYFIIQKSKKFKKLTIKNILFSNILFSNNLNIIKNVDKIFEIMNVL